MGGNGGGCIEETVTIGGPELEFCNGAGGRTLLELDQNGDFDSELVSALVKELGTLLLTLLGVVVLEIFNMLGMLLAACNKDCKDRTKN